MYFVDYLVPIAYKIQPIYLLPTRTRRLLKLYLGSFYDSFFLCFFSCLALKGEQKKPYVPWCSLLIETCKDLFIEWHVGKPLLTSVQLKCLQSLSLCIYIVYIYMYVYVYICLLASEGTDYGKENGNVNIF